MIRKLFICILACFVWVPSFAQEESVSKQQINQIKRDTSFLYSEATDETAEKALDAARTMLMAQVQEYLESNQKTVMVNDATKQSVYAKTRTLEMMRGTQHRVFVYVQKSDVNAIFGIQQQQVLAANPPISPRSGQAEEMKEKEQKVQSPTEVSKGKVQIDGDSAPSVAKESTQPANQKTVTNPGLPAWQMETIEKLLDCRDINEVRAKLNRMKVEYKIEKFGLPDNCPERDKVFWLIFNQDGRVLTILGPGTKERVSFRDMTTSELDNYKGLNALWFNFAK